MHSHSPWPADLDRDARIVLFDGVCHLCNHWTRFLVAREPRARLRLASVQSPVGQAILAWCGLPTDQFDTMVFVEQGRAHFKSQAFLRIVRYLRWPWPILSLGVVVPRPLRDVLYDLVAQNRYRLFGRDEACLMPSTEVAKRLVST